MKVLVETERLILRSLDGDHSAEVLDFLYKGRELFEKYEMTKAPLYYSEMYQKSVLSQEHAATLNNKYVRYYVYLKNDTDRVIGTVSCGNIMIEPYSCGTIGYKFDRDYWHNGYAREAVRTLIEEVFMELKLHRVIAYVMDKNQPSIRLLEAVGFVQEGFCRKNLKVNGVWENHRLYALLNPYEE